MGANLEQEVKEILKAIEDYSTNVSLWSIIAETELEKVILSIAAVSLVITVALSFIDGYKIWSVLSGLIFLMTAIILSVVGALDIVTSIKKPLEGYSELVKSRIAERIKFVQKLGGYSPEALEFTLKTLKRDMARIQERLYVLVGTTKKVGFIPAGIAFYFAATKTLAGESDVAANLLMAFVFGIYGGAFLVHRMIEALSINATLLEEAKAIADLRDTIKNPK